MHYKKEEEEEGLKKEEKKVNYDSYDKENAWDLNYFKVNHDRNTAHCITRN